MEVLLVSGSLRDGSTNTAAMRAAAELVGEAGARAVLYRGMADLPHFNPDDDREPLPPAVAELRARLAAADAMLCCTPEYAGDLPGSFKNLLDWTVGGVEIEGMPVAWVNVAAEGRGTGASRALRTVLGYTGGAVVDDACVDVPVPPEAVGPDGVVRNPTIRAAIAIALDALLATAHRRAP
ncbi:MAG: NADPH-dependent FMN reductase [Acidimicrobiales bacterium]